MMPTANLSYLDCRRIAHEAERFLRNVRDRNAFTLHMLDADLARFHAAYLDPACEPRTAHRIHAAIDMIEAERPAADAPSTAS